MDKLIIKTFTINEQWDNIFSFLEEITNKIEKENNNKFPKPKLKPRRGRKPSPHRSTDNLSEMKPAQGDENIK